MGVRLIDVVANDKVHEGRKEGCLQALGRNRSAVGSDTGEGGDGREEEACSTSRV